GQDQLSLQIVAVESRKLVDQLRELAIGLGKRLGLRLQTRSQHPPDPFAQCVIVVDRHQGLIRAGGWLTKILSPRRTDDQPMRKRASSFPLFASWACTVQTRHESN